MANLNAKPCYDAGREAKRKGLSRLTPYYEHPRADYWWLAGFDGVDFSEAAEKQPDFAATQVLSAGEAREMGLPVPKGVQEVHIHGATMRDLTGVPAALGEEIDMPETVPYMGLNR